MKIVSLGLIISFWSSMAIAKPNPYPKPEDCWAFKIPAGSVLKLKKDIVSNGNVSGTKLLDTLMIVDLGPRAFVRGNVWLLANFAATPGTPVPVTVTKKTALEITDVIVDHPPVKNCLRINVKNEILTSFDLCTDVLELTDLRVKDLKRTANKFLGLTLVDPKTKSCWIPQDS